MVASTLSESTDDVSREVIGAAAIAADRPGSDRYQQHHMSEIFSQGLSFSGFERNKVFISTPGPKYVDVSDVSGADSEGDCRGIAVADYDDDGDPDLFVNAIQRECHLLYRNELGDGGKFIKVRLRATKGHPEAIGAIVKVARAGRTTAQVHACGSGFESQGAPELIFGLGAVARAEVRVRWPGRAEEDFGTIAAGSRVLLVEGSGSAEQYPAHTFAFPPVRPRGLRFDIGAAMPELAFRPVETPPAKGAASRPARPDEAPRPLLINFWQTTCSACVKELPLLDRIAREGRYQVKTVSLDPPGREARIAELWQRGGYALEAFHLDRKEAAVLFDLDRLAIPVSLVVSPEGVIQRVISGPVPDSF